MVMRKSLGQVKEFVGVDVSEHGLDVHLLPSAERAGFSRDRRGIARLVAWLASKGRLLVVVEATGGLERGLGAALAQAGIALAVVNPRQVRDFARAAGLLAKTDRSTPMRWRSTASGCARHHVRRARPPIRRWPRWSCADASSRS
jgi:hypothetical protein